jgi:hypothetical protein
LNPLKEVYKARVSTLVRVSPEMRQGLCAAEERKKKRPTAPESYRPK